jgi:4-alpha-glucanotransferase
MPTTSAAARVRTPLLTRRQAGVLLHPSSLPEGVAGADALRFLDWLAACGFSLWQTLPAGPPVYGLSPYQALSAHAGHLGLLPAGAHARRTGYAEFQRQHAHWLDDYAQFIAIKAQQEGRPWWQWPEDLRQRRPQALEAAREALAGSIEHQRRRQFTFFTAWAALRGAAVTRGVHLLGDMPLFVAADSSDVWAQPGLFKLHRRGPQHGLPVVVAGVPPDYFSATGQRWGNPVYDWQAHTAQGFDWWRGRLAVQTALFDWVRLDHFRGLQACWEIPADEPTAINGAWVEAPGEALLAALCQGSAAPPLIAEDLGTITPEVTALRDQYGLPGMRILQFAFDGQSGNPYLPSQHTENSVVYTGTHDNDTTLGWWCTRSAEEQARVRSVLDRPCAGEDEAVWALIEAALQSPARLAIIPMQDLLLLGSEARMNTPGVENGNWTWRFQWEQITPALTHRLTELIAASGRGPA